MNKKVKFYLSPTPYANGEKAIRVSVSVNGTRLLTTAGMSVPEEAWDTDEMCAVALTKTMRDRVERINNQLLAIESGFRNYAQNLNPEDRPTNEELRDLLQSITGTQRKKRLSKAEIAKKVAEDAEAERWRIEAEKANRSVSARYDQFVAEESEIREWATGTKVTMQGFKKKLEQFATLDELNCETGIMSFISNLRHEGLTNRTIEKKFRLLRWFLTWAKRKGYIDEVCEYQPVIKLIKRPVIYLTPTELMRLYRYEVPENGTKVKLHTASGDVYYKVIEDASTLAKTRDLFCFCAFTSLRYSDMAKLRRSDITDDGITVVTKKTHDRIFIELNQFSRAILDKYKGQNFPGNLALPVLSNQQMNDKLKDLCELNEINELVNMDYYQAGRKVESVVPKYELMGTHAGRRSFIVFALTIGINPEIVMKWTGHSSYSAMKPYIDIVGKAKVAAMDKFNHIEDLGLL